MQEYRESLELARENATIFDSLVKAESVLNGDEYNNICISISGGADSDIVLDICSRVTDRDLKYVFFDTGIELGATKEHLGELEEKYGITIERCEPRMPVARVVRQYGVPFLSKFVSEQIKRLQSRGFDFVDKSYKRHYNQYWDVSSSLKWFYNEYTTNRIERNPRFRGNIGYNKYLREFLIEHPPDFSISNECCNFAKKLPAIDYAEENEVDLELLGIRKAEGGVRALTYKSCFKESAKGYPAKYFPIFWYTNQDKADYERIFGVEHSRCYTEYGMTRTGCAGCPYNINFLDDLKVMKEFEPNMYKAAMNLFGASYLYTKQYRDFCKEMKGEYKCQK